MHKVSATLLLSVLTTPLLHAQDDASVRFGIKLAPNMSWTRADTKGIDGDGNIVGYTFGLLIEFPVGANGNYRFATGVFLNNVGGKYKVDFEYRDAPQAALQSRELNNTLHLRYIEVPLTMKLMTNEIGYIRYFGQIGVSSAFNIRAVADMERPIYDSTGGYATDFEILEDEDVKDDINLFKAALVIGAGMEYNFSGSTSLLAGVTYNNAFTNILNDVQYGEKKAKLFADHLELTLGVFF